MGMRRGLGPVFAYEWLTSSRKWRVYATRSLFVSALLAALYAGWWTKGNKDFSTLRAQAELGVIFFYAVIGTQLTLVMLAAPAATAGSICLDRARGTLTHLMVTDLSDAEIVLGKLAARLVPVLGLVACALPMMALGTLLGGIDPQALFGAFLVTIGLAVLGCALALTFSIWAGKTQEALLGTYAVWGLWMMADPMIRHLSPLLPGWLPLPKIVDPFQFAFAPYNTPLTASLGDDVNFLAGCLAASAALAVLSVVRLRPVVTRQASQPAGLRRRPWMFTFGERWTEWLPGPSLDDNPVLWREWHRNRPSRWGRFLGLLYFTLAAVFSGLAIVQGGSGGFAAWVNGLQASIGLLMLSVVAATTLAEERARGSLDVLLATPLSTRSIVWGKWWGAYRLVPLLTVLPGLVALAQKRSWEGGWPHAILIVGLILAYGAAVTSLGLALATWEPRLGRAVALSVSVYLLVAVGWLFLMTILFKGSLMQGPAMASPFFGVGELTFELETRGQNYFGWGVFWALFSLGVSVSLLLWTLAAFNRYLGRASDHWTGLELLPSPRSAGFLGMGRRVGLGRQSPIISSRPRHG